MGKMMDIAEFREKGYLQEINRLLLHPLGLALQATIDADGNETLTGVVDCRDDDEGIIFATVGEPHASKAAFIAEERERRREKRSKLFSGEIVQPVTKVATEYTI
jgi:hypothetical protein